MYQPLKLLFIRHAESTGNREKRMQGYGDFPLTEVGWQQAEKLARWLLTQGCLPSHVYSSPLERATQTTQILVAHFEDTSLSASVSDLRDGGAAIAPLELQRHKIPVTYADELREFQNGIFQGLTWAEAREKYPELCQQLESTLDWIPIPGAESLEVARMRARQFIETLLIRHRNGEQVWIITHSWILQHLIAELMGCDRSWRLRSENTALFEFWIDQVRWDCADQNRWNTDLWQIRRFNDHRHLWAE